MALSQYQKDKLDRTLLDILTKKVDEDNHDFDFNALTLMVYKENYAFYNDIYNNTKNLKTTFNSALQRLMHNNLIKFEYCRDDCSITLLGSQVCLITDKQGIRKEKNRLYFDCLPNNIYYDFSIGDFNEPEKVAKARGYNPGFYSPNFREMLKYEWLFNYFHSIEGIRNLYFDLPQSAYEKMPAGLYNEIKDCDDDYETKKAFIDFYFVSKYGKYGKLVKNLVIDHTGYRTHTDYFLTHYSPEKIITLYKNELLSGDIPDEDILFELFEAFHCVHSNVDNKIEIDFNRGINYNLELLENVKDREKNNAIEKNLRKLNFINDFISDEYIVKVPQTVQEKFEEGKMQNNCVGYYYDDSIMNGKNLIYFIRHKENPNKSYITCRYNINTKKTAEYRLKNNYSVKDTKAIQLIEELDKMITKGLGV